MPVVYQPVEELFCVRAEYKYVDPEDKSVGYKSYHLSIGCS